MLTRTLAQVEPPFPTFLPGDEGDGETVELVSPATEKDPLRLQRCGAPSTWITMRPNETPPTESELETRGPPELRALASARRQYQQGSCFLRGSPPTLRRLGRNERG